MNPHLTEVALILDRSGSMQPLQEAAGARPQTHAPPFTLLLPDVDFILFPFEKLGCILYDDALAGLKAEELCEGADEVLRYWMRKHRNRRLALLSSATVREGWATFEHQGTAENGLQIDTGLLGGRAQNMKLCPNFVLYYPAPPKQLHFTDRKAKDLSTESTP